MCVWMYIIIEVNDVLWERMNEWMKKYEIGVKIEAFIILTPKKICIQTIQNDDNSEIGAHSEIFVIWSI